MAALTDSGEISILDIYRNREDDGSATDTNISLKTLSTQMAGGSVVGDIDGNGTGNLTADRNLLAAAPYAMSELYDANYPNDLFSNVVAKLGTTSVMTNGYVDLETAKIEWDVDDGTSDDYTAGLKYRTDDSVVVSADLDFDGSSAVKSVTMTVPNIAAGEDKYYPFVSTGTYSNVEGANIDHYGTLGTVTITAVGTTTVANTSTDTSITHARSIVDDGSVNDYNWSFVKTAGDGSGVSDGEGSYGTVTSTTSLPTIVYRGPATFTADLRVDGDPSQARNSSTAAQIAHRIDYTAQVTIANPSAVNKGTNYNVTGNHKGHSGGIQVDEILASNNSVLSSNDDSTDSRIVSTNYSQAITPSTGGGYNTRSVKVKAHNNSVSATSNAFNIYPLVSDYLASGDISVSVDPVIVGADTVLSVANITDSIVGYSWGMTTGAGAMSSGNASGGDTDGTSVDGTTVIDETSAATNTVSFNSAQSSKTITLTLYGKLSQTATATKTLSVELADAVAISSISSINGGSSVSVAGTQAGLQYGAYFGLVSAGATTTFLGGKTATDSQDSRYTQDSYSANISPADQNTTATYQGRVVDRTSVGGAGTSISANTSTFTVYPLLTTSKNTINPTTQTIFSQTDNPDTSTYPINFVFGNPGTRTDNATGTYNEQADSSNAIALTGDLTPSTQTATQPTCTSTTTVGGATVRYTAAGNLSQSTLTDCAVTVNYATNIYNTAASIGGQATLNSDITFSWSWQGVVIASERYELFDSEDTDTQVGNDLDVTDVTGGGAQSRTSSGSQTKTVANFGVSVGSEYVIKITLFSDSGHSTAVATALTPAFSAFAVTEFTSTIKGVGLEGEFFGYVSRLLAAENNSSGNGVHNRIISQEISGAKLFALNVNAGTLVARNNTLVTAFNPLAAGVTGATFLHRDGNVLNIGSDGVIDDVTDGTPATPAINASTVSTAADDIEIRVTVNALVTRAFTVSVTPSGGSEATNSVNASNQGSSLSQDISLKTIGFSLAAGTAHVIKIRGTNEAENGSYSSTRTFSTDSAATAWTTVPANFSLSVGSGTATSADKPYVLANQSGNTTVTFANVSGNNMFQVQFAAGTSANPTNWTNTGSTITLGAGTNYHVKVRHDYRSTFADAGHSAVFRITATNNSVSATCDVSLDYEGE